MSGTLCPKCGFDGLRRTEELGFIEQTLKPRPLAFALVPIRLGLLVISMGGTGLVVVALMLVGVENLYMLFGTAVVGVIAGAVRIFDLTRSRAPVIPVVEKPALPETICLSCARGALIVNYYDKFRLELLKTGDGVSAADPEKLRRLGLIGLPKAMGEAVGPIIGLAAGLAIAAMGVWLLTTGQKISGGVYSIIIVFGFAVMICCMGWAFWLLRKRDPATARLLGKGDYLTAPCEMSSSTLIRSEHGAIPLVEIRFTDFTGKKVISLNVYNDFNEHLAVKEFEDGLKPEDDLYELKGRRPYLPLHGWVLYDCKNPWDSQLVGIKLPGSAPG